jgi:nitrogen fixation NifU-like protein
LNELYQEVILDHYKKPRNFGVLEDATAAAHGDNPLCGDRLALHVRLAGERIEDIRFKGSGCAISTASASLMTEAVKGKTKAEAIGIFERFHPMVTGLRPGGADGASAARAGQGAADDLGKLEVFSGVSEFPVRVKCATLAWHTLKAALEGRKDPVSTE